MIENIIRVFEIEFMQHALITGLLVGAMCAYVGVYIVLRRIVFVGASLAQVSSSGFAIGMLLDWNPFGTALALTLIGVFTFAVNLNSRRIPQDSTLALGYTMASAGTILILSKHPRGDADLMGLLFGNILTITPDQIYILLAAFLVLGSIHLLFKKEFMFTSFDPEMAEVMGYRPAFWNVLFYVTLGVLISLAVKSAGILLVFGLLVIPAITAMLLTRHMGRLFLYSVLLAVAAIPAGLYLSFVWDVPSGPTVVAVLSAALAVAGLYRSLARDG